MPPLYPGGENLRVAAFRLIVGGKTSDFRLFSIQSEAQKSHRVESMAQKGKLFVRLGKRYIVVEENWCYNKFQ